MNENWLRREPFGQAPADTEAGFYTLAREVHTALSGRLLFNSLLAR